MQAVTGPEESSSGEKDLAVLVVFVPAESAG
jgi:hypothetical protein